ncbi:ATP-binding cassette domain-containing protein [Streptomyces sp. XM4193]|uniref:ATP-binding cassette domain-containing protein n=1 Tax=Streptomyces sp. XM4193 TaxID=2929782 RepID=UPI001FF98B5E|nr:ATP-binding cassette domain-containing protein [Streptomyces sp. XM4193]MCK1794893.1 ATP-binding cassette domain-containing protein [Streptomyces sp. XM4193]
MPLRFSSCTFGYRRKHPVLRDLDCDLPTGRTVFLGPNGAGKSTVLGLGASALLPVSGQVGYRRMRTDDRRTLREYRRRVAWMPQHLTTVPGLTARDQVAYAGWLKGMSRTEAWDGALDALRRVEIPGPRLRSLRHALTNAVPRN